MNATLVKLGLVTLLGSGALAVGCGDASQVGEIGEPEVGQQIYGGEPAGMTGKYGAVVSLHEASGRGVYKNIFCSGTLITPTVVLTAAHCLDTSKLGQTSFVTRSPNSVRIYVGTEPMTATSASQFAEVSETKINPGYNKYTLDNDIALLRLKNPVTSVAPVPALPASKGFTQADADAEPPLALDFVGFGYDEDRNINVKLQFVGELGGLGCDVEGCGDAGFPEHQISYNQGNLDDTYDDGEGGPCNGDSGGPAFVDRTETVDGVEVTTTYVGGVTSYGDADCLVYGVSTRADAYESWIDEFANPPPPPPAPTCDNDGRCEIGESCDGRNGTASCSGDCPKVKKTCTVGTLTPD
jgi:hypothetical protein